MATKFAQLRLVKKATNTALTLPEMSHLWKKLPRDGFARAICPYVLDTMYNRLPKVITGVIDYFDTYNDKYINQKKLEPPDLKLLNEDRQSIRGRLHELLANVRNNAPLAKFNDGLVGQKMWNSYLDEYAGENFGRVARFKEMNSVAVEGYVYRAIHSILRTSLQTDHFSYLDPFYASKRESLLSATQATNIIFSNVINIPNRRLVADEYDQFEEFEKFLEFSLWSNKSSDLCIKAGKEGHANFGLLTDLQQRKPNILTNSSGELYQLFQEFHDLGKQNKEVKIDFVLDNVGLELISDLCFLEMLYQSRLINPSTTTIRFWVKQIPWFISDVTNFDFMATLEHLFFNVFDEFSKKEIVLRWNNLFAQRRWQLKVHPFFTTPYEFYKMERVAPDLYRDLASSDLLIFKGDLNYVKLMGNLFWHPETPFSIAIQNFKPTNLVTVRAAKYNLVVNLEDERALDDLPTEWYSNGDYGVISLYRKP